MAAGVVLTVTGFVVDQTLTDTALNGIFLVMTLVPAVSALLSIIPFRWYKLNEAEHARIVAKLGTSE